jgi:hypothetical protein
VLTSLVIGLLVLLAVAVVVLGVYATVLNYETHGFFLGWILSNWMWEGIGNVLVAIGELIAALASSAASGGD